MTTLRAYYKALTPTLAFVAAVANSAGPQSKFGYVLISALGMLGVIFGPANVPVPNVVSGTQVPDVAPPAPAK